MPQLPAKRRRKGVIFNLQNDFNICFIFIDKKQIYKFKTKFIYCKKTMNNFKKQKFCIAKNKQIQKTAS